MLRRSRAVNGIRRTRDISAIATSHARTEMRDSSFAEWLRQTDGVGDARDAEASVRAFGKTVRW
jgi:hypothetical protein